MDPSEIKQLLENSGIQASAPRLAVADYVLQTKNHPTADEIKAEVEKRMPAVSLATIYNSLNLFVDKGLLISLNDPLTDKKRYDCNTKAHYHFFDEDSGQLLDLEPSVLKVSPNLTKLTQAFEVHGIDVMVRGRVKKKPPLEN